MKEIKIIVLVQIGAILLLGGVALGTLAGYPVYITKIVKVMPEQVYPEYVMKHAKRYHNIPVATKEECGDWIGIRKDGVPIKIFREVK